MEKFFASMTAEDKQKMMMDMMPKMMEGINMAEMMPQMMMTMMSGMLGRSQGGSMMEMMSGMIGGRPQAENADEASASPEQSQMEGLMMPNMMKEMMPHCLDMMLPNMPKEERIDFVLNMIDVLKEQGSTGMSDEERQDFVARIVEKVTDSL